MIPVFNILNPSGPMADRVKSIASRGTGLAPWALISREHPRHTETVLDWIQQEGVKRVVVWGGDGTFHRVIKGLAERHLLLKTELALVPAGTCNDLARFFNINRDMWPEWQTPSPRGRLASLALAQLVVERDGVKEKEVFINNAGFGRTYESFQKKEKALGVLKAFQAVRVKARWIDGELRGLYYLVLACNAPYFSGGLHFERNVSPEEGVLRVFFLPARSKPRLALRLILGRLGFPLLDDKMTKVSAAKISIETERPVWPQTDGEPPSAEGCHTLEFSILPQRVRMWCPI